MPGGGQAGTLEEPLLAGPVDMLDSGSLQAGPSPPLPTFASSQAAAAPLPWRHPAPSGHGYWQIHARMAAWLAALFAVYAVQRACCRWLGLPNDGIREADALESFSDASALLTYGGLLGWWVGATCPRRFAWLFSRRRWYAWAVLLGTPPVYSLISDVHVLKRDLADLSAWGAPFIALWAAGVSAMVGVVGWHILTVSRHRSTGDAAAYVVSRAAVFAFFAGGAVVLRRAGVGMHLHHLYLGWALALWAELDHWLSALTLAVGTGIFLQGTASYSFAPVFSERCFSSPSAAAFECAFTAPSPFTLTICSATGPMPSHSCH